MISTSAVCALHSWQAASSVATVCASWQAGTDMAVGAVACRVQVRHMLASHGRLHEVTQVILNPSDEPYFNVISTMSNKEDVKVSTLHLTIHLS
jgi:hypothetical protein